MVKLPTLAIPKQKISLLIAALFLAAQALLVLPAITTAQAVPGNDGTLKVHEKGTPEGESSEPGSENNDPKVCNFNFEGFGFDEDQEGYITIDGQGQSAGSDFGPFNIFGPADENGYYATAYFNENGGVATIPDGHYKATLFGKDNEGQINLEDEKAKSKVFKVECEEEDVPAKPTALASILACTPQSGETDRVNVDITNTDDDTDDAVTYTALLGGQNKLLSDLADGATGSLIFSGLSVGKYSASVTGDDGTEVTSNEVTVNECKKGEVLGDSMTTTTSGQVLGASTQVTAPVGGVGAGGAGSIVGSLVGLGTSLSAVGYGAVTLRKKQ